MAVACLCLGCGERTEEVSGARALPADGELAQPREDPAGRAAPAEVPDGMAEALRHLRSKAEGGDAESQLNLARLLLLGRGVPRDVEGGMRWLRVAAEAGYAPAQVVLGRALADGLAGASDPAAAVRWYERAAAQGNAEATYLLGRMVERGRGTPASAERAALLYRHAAEHGSVPARTRLGILYARGEGVPRDPRRALELFLEAGQAGDPRALLWAARLYEGAQEGVPRDEAVARRLLARAADVGLVDAQLALARLLSETGDTPAEREEALLWAEIALLRADGERDRAEATELRDALARTLTPADIERIRALAQAWKPGAEAAMPGHGDDEPSPNV